MLAVSLGNGLNSFTQNIFKQAFSSLSAAAFNFYVYVFSAVLLGITYLCLKDEQGEENEMEKQPLFDKAKLIYIAVMAVCLFCNSYFVTLANGYLPAVKLNPLLNVLSLLVTTVLSVACFKEKLKTASVIGISLMLVGVIFINVLGGL